MLVSMFSTFRYGYWRYASTGRFFLDPGSYHLYVRDGNRDMFNQDLRLDNNVDTIGLDLSNSNLTPPTTKPTGAFARTESSRSSNAAAAAR